MTPYSIASAIIWSNLFIILLYLLRTKKFAIDSFGILPLTLIAAICFLRLFVCFDLPYTRGIFLYGRFAEFVKWSQQPLFTFFEREYTFENIAFFLWGVGIVIAALGLLATSLQVHLKCFSRNEPADAETERLAGKIAEAYGGLRYRIRKNPVISEPLVYGLFVPTILLPEYEIGEAELECVLAHEFYHIAHHDILIKAFGEIVRIVFWWNPISWLFVKELNNILELRNDGGIVKNYSAEYRVFYASTITEIAKKATLYRKFGELPHGTYCGFVSKKQDAPIKQRVKLILDYRQPSKLQTVMIYALIALFFFTSHAFVIQPAWEPDPGESFSAEEIIEGDSYFTLKENGMYELIINGKSAGELYPEELEKEPFNEIKIRVEK